MSFTLRYLQLDRPLAVLDLETTGIDPEPTASSRSPSCKLAPGGEPVRYRRRVNPGVPIPPAATAVHGITDDDVAGRPASRTIAPRLARLLDGATWPASTSVRFDLPLLVAEFNRAGVDFPVAGRASSTPADLPPARAARPGRRRTVLLRPGPRRRPRRPGRRPGHRGDPRRPGRPLRRPARHPGRLHAS